MIGMLFSVAYSIIKVPPFPRVKGIAFCREDLILRGPRLSSFWIPRTSPILKDIRQARTGDTVLVKSREMTGRTQTLSWWLGGEGIQTTKTK